MKIHPVKQYYKDPSTGIEMSFHKLEEWGWSVGFHNCTLEESLDYKGHIPWPTLSEEEQSVVGGNYQKLMETLEKDD